jgi:hypothetical protein
LIGPASVSVGMAERERLPWLGTVVVVSAARLMGPAVVTQLARHSPSPCRRCSALIYLLDPVNNTWTTLEPKDWLTPRERQMYSTTALCWSAGMPMR